MNKIFDQKSEFGNEISSVKAELDKLMNLQENRQNQAHEILNREQLS